MSGSETEKLARELALADGFNPDDMVLPAAAPILGVRHLQIIDPKKLVPTWRYYDFYVRRLLASLVANLKERPDEDHFAILEAMLQESDPQQPNGDDDDDDDNPDDEDEEAEQRDWRDNYGL